MTVVDSVGRVAPVVLGVSVNKKAKAGALIAAARSMLEPPPGPRETFVLMQGGSYYSTKVYKEGEDLPETSFMNGAHPMSLIRWAAAICIIRSEDSGHIEAALWQYCPPSAPRV